MNSLIHWFTGLDVLSPRGTAALPTTEEELVSAIICVLKALEVLHQEPPMLRRDIR